MIALILVHGASDSWNSGWTWVIPLASMVSGALATSRADYASKTYERLATLRRGGSRWPAVCRTWVV